VKELMLLSILQESLQVWVWEEVVISKSLLNFTFTELFSTPKRIQPFFHAVFNSTYKKKANLLI